MISVLAGCQREIGAPPEEIRGDIADALARLDAGLKLTMPLSRPMPSIDLGVHELRLKDRSGQYRIIYALIESGVICDLHAFKKTTETMAKRNIDLARQRLREART